MPMDIRNFFAKKGSSNPSKSKSKSSSSSTTDDKTKQSSVNRSSSSVKRSKTAPLSPIDEERPKVAKRHYHLNSDSNDDESVEELSKKKSEKPKKRQYHLNSDSDEEFEGDSQKKSAAKDNKGSKSRKKQQDNSEDEDSEGDAEYEKKAVTAGSNRKKENDPKKEVAKKEVSVSAFFASSSSSSKGGGRSSARKNNKPKRSYVLDDSSEEEEDVQEEKKPRKKNQKDSDEYIGDDDDEDDDDNDNDDDDYKQEKNNSRKRSSPTKASKSPPIKPVRKESPFKKQKIEDEDVVNITNDDDHQDFDEIHLHNKNKTPPSSSKNKRRSTKASEEEEENSKSSTPAPTKKRKTQTGSNKKPPTKAAAAAKEPLIEPALEVDNFNVDEAVSECMAGTTFVFSGVLDGLSRDEGSDLVKCMGGRVTTAVSSKTSYLVVGELLEDGRSYEEGTKYKKAASLGTVKIVKGEKKLYGLAKLYNDRAKAKQPASLASSSSAAGAGLFTNPYAKKMVANPYAKKGTVVNPYAKKGAVNNPYAKKSGTANLYAKKSSNAGGVNKDYDAHVDQKKFGPNDLWVDKYAPVSTRNILGNKDLVTKLTTWLTNWERKFNNDKAVGKAFSNPNGPWKAALLSGPPGIGKTTTATLVAKEAGRDTLEFNASDVRSKKVMSECFGDIIGSQSVVGFFQKVGSGNNNNKPGKSGPTQKKLRCLIFDEVDGMSAGDRGGMAELIQMIKNSRVPIICICNDRQSQKMKSLLPYCFDLRFRRPVKSQIAKAAMKVAQQEGLRVEQNAAEAMAESCGNDIRQVINALQMWASEKECNTMTYKGLKEREKAINKDEILRVSLFDASKLILEGRRGVGEADAEAQRSNFFKRNDAFFTDYSFTGLIVQQNYLKVMNVRCNELKRKKDDDLVLDFLDDVHDAAQTMSDYAMVEHKIRGGSDMNWSLLPFAGTLVVKNGFHASGPKGAMFPGFPEFTTWLGRNSSKGKKQRVLQELNHHMNYKISGGTQEVRLSYLPYLRGRFHNQLKESQGVDRNAEAIELMDDYGLDRDDVFENLDEFNLSKASKLGDLLDSKEKAAFTRAFNASAHKSQALVSEQGAPKKNKRKGGSSADLEDPDAINDDNFEEDEDEEDDEFEMKKIQAAFAKNKGRGKGKAAGAKTASKGKGKGRGKK